MTVCVLLAGCKGPPELSDLAVVTEGFIAGIAFAASDPNKDLDGGEVFVDFGDNDAVYPLISEDPSEERKGVIVALAYRYPACDAGRSVGVGVVVADAEGMESNELTTSVTLDGDAEFETEPNGAGSGGDVFTYGGGAFGICGEVTSTGAAGGYYNGDHDYFLLHSDVNGYRRFVLQQPTYTFLDLWVDDEVVRAEEGSVVAGFRVVELEVLLYNNQSYWLLVAAGDGPTGPYSVFVE